LKSFDKKSADVTAPIQKNVAEDTAKYRYPVLPDGNHTQQARKSALGPFVEEAA